MNGPNSNVYGFVKRVFDLSASLILLLASAPLLGVIYLALRLRGPAILTVGRLGRHARPFREFFFTRPQNRLFAFLPLHRLPVLFNVLKGDMSFIGPRPAAPDEPICRQRAAAGLAWLRPGLTCLWWIRKRTNIDYGNELDADCEYADRLGLKSDIGLFLRTFMALLYGRPADALQPSIEILGVPLVNLSMDETLDWINKRLHGPTPVQVCFVNADCINIAVKNHAYAAILQQSDLSLADGIGLKLAGKILGSEIRQNVNGTDLFPRLCQLLSGTDYGIFLLGGRPGVADGVQSWVRKHYPDTRISGIQHGYFPAAETPQVLERIAASNAAILLVAMGVPMQEEWIKKHLPQTGVKVAMGVGGLFDFYSGRIRRAPLWMREIGMEWVYRLIQEPGRMWKRYIIGNNVFLWRVIRHKTASKKRPPLDK